MAHHKPVSKTQWMQTQKRELQKQRMLWKKRGQPERQKKFYQRYLKSLEPDMVESSRILEIGCGVACTAQYFPLGSKLFIDPLLDDFKRTFPALLPDHDLVNKMAEHIEQPDQSFDLILCLDALDRTLNPELVLHEARRLLKPGGKLILSIHTVSSLWARLHYMMLKAFPNMTRESLYRYSFYGITNTLERYFNITEHWKIQSSIMRNQWIFICEHRA